MKLFCFSTLRARSPHSVDCPELRVPSPTKNFVLTVPLTPRSTLLPYTTLFRSIAEMQNETQKEIAGIQSATSRQNTKDQVYAQNEMLAYQQKESTARVASIMENTNLSKQQQVSEIMRQMLTQA